MSAPKRKRKDGYLSKFFAYINSSDEILLIVTLSFLSLIFASGLISNLKFFFPILFIASIYLSVRFKSLFLAFFLISIFTFQFFNPQKYYIVEVLRGSELTNIEFKTGRILGYGVNLEDIFIVFSTSLMLSEIFKRGGFRKKISNSYIQKILLFIIVFFIYGVGVALSYSPFFIPSVIWTGQYLQLFLIAILLFYCYLFYRDKFNLVFIVISFSIYLQFFLSILQFLNQSPLGIPIESSEGILYGRGLDEIKGIYRVSGTFMIHNQLALIITSLLVIILPKALKERKLFYLISLFALFVTVIMTQSRIIWIAIFVIGLLSVKFFLGEIKVLLLKYKRALIYMIVMASFLSFIVIPRILLSLNTQFEGAGIPIRIKMIAEAFEALVANPFIGYGAGTNEYILHSLFPEGVMDSFPYPVHQGHLQFLLEFGIIGAFVFALPFYIVARKVVITAFKKRQYFNKNKDLIFTFTSGLLLFTLYYTFQAHVGIMEFTYLGLILGFGIIAIYKESLYK